MKLDYDTTTTGTSGGRRWSDRTAVPQALPTRRALRAWRKALATDARRLGHLTATRGLQRSQIGAYGLGLDGSAYVLPVCPEGKLVNVVWHRPWSVQRYSAATGHPACLYPTLPRSGAVVLCGGMFDALIGLQHGLPVCTTTCGALLPGHLRHHFAGKKVVVIYDVGESGEAIATVAQLRAVGAESAWFISLPLEPGEDLSDWFVKYGRSRDELLKLIREARP